MKTMLEVGHLPITVDSLVAQPRQQALESGGQPGHYGILRGVSFKSFEDRVETEARIRPDAEFANVRWHVGEAGVQQLDTALPGPRIAGTQFGVP